MNDFLQIELFSVGDYQLTVAKLSIALLAMLAALLLYLLLNRKLMRKYYQNQTIPEKQKKRVARTIKLVFFVLSLIGVLWALEIDEVLYSTENITIRISTLLQALLILLLAQILDWIISGAISNYYKGLKKQQDSDPDKAEKKDNRSANNTVQYIVYVLAIILILRNFNLNYTLIEEYNFRISSIFTILLILLFARVFAWGLIHLILYRYYKKNEVNVGSQFAINQLLKYVIYVIAIFMAIENIGIDMTVIWGGGAALLVGLGLGLQQTFNDLVSGIILLFERTVEVGDVVEISSLVGTVKKIGLRTSLVESRDNIIVIVPNSKLIVDNVVNWSHDDDKARFRIAVGVAYGSDTELVKKLLLQVAKENIYVLKYPSSRIRLISFGESSLDFELLFWSRNFIVIEDVKSDLRFAIDKAFRENNIEIPFPQRDIWHRVKKD